MITKADITFDYFSSEGVPLRARVTLSLTQFEPDGAFLRQNPTSGTPRPHRVHRIQRGETLDRISARYYGDADPLALAGHREQHRGSAGHQARVAAITIPRLDS